jgi:hypothetical protein
MCSYLQLTFLELLFACIFIVRVQFVDCRDTESINVPKRPGTESTATATVRPHMQNVSLEETENLHTLFTQKSLKKMHTVGPICAIIFCTYCVMQACRANLVIG